MDRGSREVGGGELQKTGLSNQPPPFAALWQLDRDESIAFDLGQAVESSETVIGHDVIRVDEMFHAQTIFKQVLE